MLNVKCQMSNVILMSNVISMSNVMKCCGMSNVKCQKSNVFCLISRSCEISVDLVRSQYIFQLC